MSWILFQNVLFQDGIPYRYTNLLTGMIYLPGALWYLYGELKSSPHHLWEGVTLEAPALFAGVINSCGNSILVTELYAQNMNFILTSVIFSPTARLLIYSTTDVLFLAASPYWFDLLATSCSFLVCLFVCLALLKHLVIQKRVAGKNYHQWVRLGEKALLSKMGTRIQYQPLLSNALKVRPNGFLAHLLLGALFQKFDYYRSSVIEQYDKAFACGRNVRTVSKQFYRIQTRIIGETQAWNIHYLASYLRKLVKRYPGDPYIWATLGLLLVAARYRERAKRAFQKAVRYETKEPDFWIRLGMCSSQYAVAIKCFKTALSLKTKEKSLVLSLLKEVENKQEREQENVRAYQSLFKDGSFRENLSKLGKFEYFDEGMEEPIVQEYWTPTRWKMYDQNEIHHVLSPAIWVDAELEIRFSMSCYRSFTLKVYVKKPNFEGIIGKIGCHKVVVEYDSNLDVNKVRHISLEPKEELMATIQNLDYYFTEKVPAFEGFDSNIVYQALQMVIDKGHASEELLTHRMNGLVKNLLLLLKKEDEYVGSQIYLQLKALLDFPPERWTFKVMNKFNLLGYLGRILETEEGDAYPRACEVAYYLLNEDTVGLMKARKETFMDAIEAVFLENRLFRDLEAIKSLPEKKGSLLDLCEGWDALPPVIKEALKYMEKHQGGV